MYHLLLRYFLRYTVLEKRRTSLLPTRQSPRFNRKRTDDGEGEVTPPAKRVLFEAKAE